MECTLCGGPLSSVDKDGICSRCSEDTEADGHGMRRPLTKTEFEILLSELAESLNE